MITHKEPIVGPDPGSPPDEPKFMEPTRGEVDATIRLGVKEILRAGRVNRNDPLITAVEDAICRLDLGELLVNGVHESDLVCISDDVVMELYTEIQNILKTTPHEDWPV